MPLIMLCVDGLDPDLASEYGFRMPYERKLTIPEELYFNATPWTPYIWGSMFAGRIEVHPYVEHTYTSVNPIRKKIRKFLIQQGITWYRKGLKINRLPPEGTPRFDRIVPVINENVLEHYNSLDYHIPAISHDYFYGGDKEYVVAEYKLFTMLATMVQTYPLDLVALYIRKIDHLGHRVVGNKGMDVLIKEYEKVFTLAQMLSGDIMLVSDHGCTRVHTDYAYLGCTQPVYAESITDVRMDIEEILQS